MKTSRKKSILIAAILGVASLVSLMLAQAQGTGGTDSIVAIAADSQSLPQIASNQVPVRGGTYWWVYPGGVAVPTPVLPAEAGGPIYSITSNEFLVDMTAGTVLVTPRQLAAEAGRTNAYAAAVTAQLQGVVDLITWLQSPPPEAQTLALRANDSPMGGGFSPMGVTYNPSNNLPYLTIAPTGTNQVTVTIINGITNTIYEIYGVEFLTDTNWALVAEGTAGQTNFVFPTDQMNTEFFQAVNGNDFDGDGIPNWEDARPFDPSVGLMTVTIESPANGSNVQ